MSKVYDYFTPNLPKEVEKEIEELFEDLPRIKNLYGNNKRDFVAACIRKQIFEFRDKYEKELLVSEKQLESIDQRITELRQELSEFEDRRKKLESFLE